MHASERQPHRKMQTHRVCLLAVGNVHSDRPRRRAHPAADSIAVNRFQIPWLIGGVARVDEGRDAPNIADPAHDFSAAERVVASADRRTADARSEAGDIVPARGRSAAGAEEKLDPYVARLARGDGAPLELEYDL